MEKLTDWQLIEVVVTLEMKASKQKKDIEGANKSMSDNMQDVYKKHHLDLLKIIETIRSGFLK